MTAHNCTSMPEKPNRPDGYCLEPIPYFEEYRDTIGRCPWWLSFGVPFVILCLSLAVVPYCSHNPEAEPSTVIEVSK